MDDDRKLPRSLFTTEQVRPRDQFDAWHESISVIFETSPLPEVRTDAGFAASVDAYHLGGLMVTRVDFDGQQFQRDRRKITLDGLDHYLVQLYATGGLTGSADDRERVLGGGDVQILDLTRTNLTHARSSTTIGVIVPRETLGAALSDTNDLHGLVLRGRAGTGGLLADYMRSLSTRADAITQGDAPSIARATTDMIAACFRSTAATVARARSVLDQTLLERIQRHIEKALQSPELGPLALCTAFRISRTQLYRLFEPIGGVAAYIQERRLARACADLADPAKAGRKVYDIAYDWGFVNETHFSRAFRRAFGMTQGEVRAGAASGVTMAESNLVDLGSERAYRGWLRSLRHALGQSDCHRHRHARDSAQTHAGVHFTRFVSAVTQPMSDGGDPVRQ
jgi:AraC-like DNA-binding protein